METRLPRNRLTPVYQGWIDAAKNQVLQAADGTVRHDAAGNMNSHPNLGALKYDAEGRQVGVGTTVYGYDGEGRRVKKTVSGAVTYYVYDGAGQLMAEYGGGNATAGRRYVTVDHLGSTRVMTDGSGVVTGRCDYRPFGELMLASQSEGNRNLIPEYACGDGVAAQKFTGKERDAESGLDYFGARYFRAVLWCIWLLQRSPAIFPRPTLATTMPRPLIDPSKAKRSRAKASRAHQPIPRAQTATDQAKISRERERPRLSTRTNRQTRDRRFA